MNRYLFFFIIVLFIGCDKTEDNIFTQTPDERLKATADELFSFFPYVYERCS